MTANRCDRYGNFDRTDDGGDYQPDQLLARSQLYGPKVLLGRIGFSSGGSRAGHQADTTSPTKRSKMPAENAAIPTTRPRCWSAITRRPGTACSLSVLAISAV